MIIITRQIQLRLEFIVHPDHMNLMRKQAFWDFERLAFVYKTLFHIFLPVPKKSGNNEIM